MAAGILKRRLEFTLAHGFVVSIFLHAAPVLPVIFAGAISPDTDEAPLVVELEGLTADTQAMRKVVEQQQQPEGAATNPQEAAPQPPARQAQRPEEIVQQADVSEPSAAPPQPEMPPAAESQPDAQAAPANKVIGADDAREAQTIQAEPDEAELLRQYVKALTKRVQSKLVYPAEGRRAGLHGTATVSFRILRDGNVEADSVRIVSSSRQPKLDESALKTIRASAPFAPPPKEMTIEVAVAFGRKS
jgi:protein TonB